MSKYTIILGLVIIMLIISTRESFTNAQLAIGIRDMVDNNLNVVQYREKYGNLLSSLKVNYLVTAYKNGELTNDYINTILRL